MRQQSKGNCRLLSNGRAPFDVNGCGKWNDSLTGWAPPPRNFQVGEMVRHDTETSMKSTNSVSIAESAGFKSAERFPYWTLAMPLTPGTRKKRHPKSTEAQRVTVDGTLMKYEPVFCFRK